MKPIRWFLVLAVLTGGCLNQHQVARRQGPPPAPVATPAIPVTPAAMAPSGPVVREEQVTRENAHQKCDSLWEELDRDDEGVGLPAPAEAGRRK
jgi:hypothetical protein